MNAKLHSLKDWKERVDLAMVWEVTETKADGILDVPLNLDDLLAHTNNLHNPKNENHEEITID